MHQGPEDYPDEDSLALALAQAQHLKAQARTEMLINPITAPPEEA